MPDSSTGDSSQTDMRSDKPQRPGFKRRLFLGLCTLGAVAIAHTWYSGSHVDDRAVTISRLETGPVTQIISWDRDNTAVQLSQLSELPSDDLWRVVTDQGRFDEFMPYVRTTTVSEGLGGTGRLPDPDKPGSIDCCGSDRADRALGAPFAEIRRAGLSRAAAGCRSCRAEHPAGGHRARHRSLHSGWLPRRCAGPRTGC